MRKFVRKMHLQNAPFRWAVLLKFSCEGYLTQWERERPTTACPQSITCQQPSPPAACSKRLAVPLKPAHYPYIRPVVCIGLHAHTTTYRQAY